MLEGTSNRSRPTAGTAWASLASALVLTISVCTGQAAAGGTVMGSVKLKGAPPPPPAAVPVTTNTESCGTEHKPEPLVGADGSVRWAVIRIIGAKGAFAAEAEPPTLDQRGCKFTPHVVVVPVGKPLKILNNDGILHNVHTFSEKNTPVNTAQPGFKKTMDVAFDKPEIMRVACDVHPWMGGQIVATDTPFVGVTDDKGNFSIEGVPAGSYSVSVWHESFGEQTLKVTVAEGKKATLAVTRAAQWGSGARPGGLRPAARGRLPGWVRGSAARADPVQGIRGRFNLPVRWAVPGLLARVEVGSASDREV